MKIVIAFILACLIISQLERVGVDKKLSDVWKILIGVVIGAGIFALLNMIGL